MNCPPDTLPLSKSCVNTKAHPAGTVKFAGVIPARRLCGAVTVNPPGRVADEPPGFVTFTSTRPAPIAGTEAVNCVALTKTVDATFVPPKATVAPDPKFVPLMVTCVPGGPELGEILAIVGFPTGGVVKANPPASLPDWPSGFWTVTSTVPAAFAGVTAWICVALLTVTADAGAVPNKTSAPARKFVPVIDTEVPPALEPLLGEMLATVGAGLLYTKPLSVLDCPSGFWTTTSTVPTAWAGV